MNRWGLSVGVSPREPFENVGAFAAAADARGFDQLWYIDFQLGMKDVYAAMNVAALHTANIGIGPAVTNIVTRHPTVTANAITALDELSNGRAVLGLGSGWSAVYGAGGKPSRMAELGASIDEFRALFTGDEHDLYGGRIQLATARRQIPIYLGVSQPRILRLCGQKADGAILMGAANVDFCSWQLDHIYAGLEDAGRDRKEILIDLFITISVDDDEDLALADVRAWATSQAATFAPWKEMPPGFETFRPEFKRAADAYHLVDHLSVHAGHRGLVSEEFVRAVAIAGNARECVARLQELAQLDIDRITFAVLPRGRLRRLETLAADVIPAVGAVLTT